MSSCRLSIQGAIAALVLTVGWYDTADAYTCEPDSVPSRTIPHRSKWRLGVREREMGTATTGWVKLALGFDWRLMNEPTFHLVELPRSPQYTMAFFATIGTPDYCGSGGCTTSLYSCRDDRCKEIGEYFDGRIYFPGTASERYPDFVIDGTDLYTHQGGRYRRVCRVTELPR
jgi:hypothetical protein